MSSAKRALQGSGSRICLCTPAGVRPAWPKEAGVACTDEAEPGLDGELPRLQSRVQDPSRCRRNGAVALAATSSGGPFPPCSRRGLTCGAGLPSLSLSSSLFFHHLLVLWKGEPDSEQAWHREVWGPVTSEVPVNLGGPVWLTGATLLLV